MDVAAPFAPATSASPPPPPTPATTPNASAMQWASPTLQFRGRIFHPEDGYRVRTLLELNIRAGIGAILNKREWWVKWRRDGGAIRDKWFAEFERLLIAQTLQSSTREWSPWGLEVGVVQLCTGFPEDGSDDQKRAFVDKLCSAIPYNLIWHEEWWEELEEGGLEANAELMGEETPEEFDEGNARMESYGQITWYFALVLFYEILKGMPLDQWEVPQTFEPGSEEAVARATEFILAVHRGEVTKDTFVDYCPNGDHRRQIVDALWVHVDRIMLELVEIRACMTKTLEKVIENNRLDTEKTVTEFVSPGPVQETWMSDVMIKDELKRKFVSEVAVLEDVPEEDKDWHPESNNLVLDLVHPSLYCCVFGKTKGLASSSLASEVTAIGMGTVDGRMQSIIFGASQIVKNEHRGSAQYQWIPSDFAVAENGDVEILSYINNLHPIKHRAIYDSIGRIFKEFVPMFNRVLSCLLNPDGPLPTMECPDLYGRETDEIPAHPEIPDILRLHPPGTPFSLRGKKVQVIVKIAEIHLTPESPNYPGGSWHVEGSDAEQIVATGIYYFGCENITESKLSFRVIVGEPDYEQNDTVGMQAAYGLARDELLVQNLGAVMATENRCVVFPNTLQHRVEPFGLVDKTRSGVRKILAFFIVDPSKQIPSTSAIPPQQVDWLSEGQDPLLTELQNLRMLPDDVFGKSVKELLDTSMTLAEAKKHRAELMGERKPVADEDEDYELFFSLCEH